MFYKPRFDSNPSNFYNVTMQETKDIERIVEEVVERKLDLIIKVLRGAIMSDVATKSDLKLLMEMMDKRFEAMEKRFEDLVHYTDKKFDILLKVIFSFNIPILIGIIALLLKVFLLG